MDLSDPNLKKANWRLLAGLILFAIVLTALIITWMHFRSERIYRERTQQTAPTSSLDRKDFCC